MKFELLKKISCTLYIIIFSFQLCQSQSGKFDSKTEHKIDSLISIMSLEEKIGQTAQRGTSSRVKILPEELKEAVHKGLIGSMLNVTNRDNVDELQRIAVEKSPHRIPLLFARDVIHGYKTIFPIPLAQAATWNPQLVERGASIAAEEASTVASGGSCVTW